MLARCLLYETDHLRGVLYVDPLSSVDRARILDAHAATAPDRAGPGAFGQKWLMRTESLRSIATPSAQPVHGLSGVDARSRTQRGYRATTTRVRAYDRASAAQAGQGGQEPGVAWQSREGSGEEVLPGADLSRLRAWYSDGWPMSGIILNKAGRCSWGRRTRTARGTRSEGCSCARRCAAPPQGE